MMREAYRPFTKIVTLSDQDELTIDLQDSAGSSISCNYIKVEAVSGGAGSGEMFFAFPVGISVGSSVAASGLASVAGSGVLGVGAAIGTGSVVLSLSPSDACSSIKLSQTITGSVAYAITYGVVTLSNPIRDTQFDSGS